MTPTADFVARVVYDALGDELRLHDWKTWDNLSFEIKDRYRRIGQKVIDALAQHEGRTVSNLSYYLDEVDDTPSGRVGPFATSAAAAEFARRYDMGQDVHIVSDNVFTTRPDQYAADNAWRLEDQ